MDTDLITTSEAARILGRSERTVKAKAKDGKLAYVAKLPGATGAYLFDRAAIEELAVAAANREAADSVRGAA